MQPIPGFVPLMFLIRIAAQEHRCGMSSIRLNQINDYARHGYRLRVDCRDCGRRALLEPTELSALCVKHGWSRDMFSLETRLRCSNCGGKNVLSGPSFAN